MTTIFSPPILRTFTLAAVKGQGMLKDLLEERHGWTMSHYCDSPHMTCIDRSKIADYQRYFAKRLRSFKLDLRIEGDRATVTPIDISDRSFPVQTSVDWGFAGEERTVLAACRSTSNMLTPIYKCLVWKRHRGVQRRYPEIVYFVGDGNFRVILSEWNLNRSLKRHLDSCLGAEPWFPKKVAAHHHGQSLERAFQLRALESFGNLPSELTCGEEDEEGDDPVLDGTTITDGDEDLSTFML